LKEAHIKFINSIGIYAIARISTYAAPLILLPILTHMLTVDDYGVIGIFTSFYLAINMFISLSGTGAVVRAYMDKDDIGFDFSSYVFNAILINTILFILSLIPLYFIFVSKLIILPLELFVLAPVVVILSNFKAYKHKLWNIQNKALNFSIFQVLFTFFSLLVSILLLYFMFQDWRSRVYAIVSAELIFCIISLYYLVKEDKVKFTLNKLYMLDVLKYGLPLLPHAIGITLLATSDKLILGVATGMSSVGIFSVAASISTLVLLVSMPVESALNPYIYRLFKTPTDLGKQRYVAGFVVYFFITSLFAMALYLTLPVVIEVLIGKEFHSAIDYVGVLLIGQVAHAMYRYIVKPIFFVKKTYLVSLSTIISGVFGVSIQLLLVDEYGIMGVAMGTSMSYIVSLILVWYFSNKIYKMPWSKAVSSIFMYKTLL
jgi:O-antigen/teichoic acid export membrane protein